VRTERPARIVATVSIELRRRRKIMDYLVVMTTRVPDGVSEQEVADVRSREAAHTHVLALEGHLLRLWRPPLEPGQWRTIGLFAAADPADLERTLAPMPLRIWRTDDITPLGAHPNDPGPGRTAVDPTRAEFLTTLVVTVPAGADPAR
jgi:muconolactone delta-isomerase